MSVSPPDFLALATRLNTQGCDEITRRCVVSRAYYAALHAVANTFDARPQEVGEQGESSHARVIGRARTYANTLNPGRTNAAQIAKLMPKLRRTRNRADYELDDEFSAQDCDDVALRAATILALCDEVARVRGAAS